MNLTLDLVLCVYYSPQSMDNHILNKINHFVCLDPESELILTIKFVFL